MSYKALIVFSCINTLLQISRIPVDVSAGKIIRINNFPSAYVDPRIIDIWLPGGYSDEKKYTALYMQDGQMLFDSNITWNNQEWGVDESMSRLISLNRIKECIVVGIWNNGIYRRSEYFPQTILDSLPVGLRELIIKEALQNKPQSDNYLKFLTHELKPFIDSNFPTLKDPENTFIMGSSSGALISIYAMCIYPEIFGGAACMSTHWPMVPPDMITEETEILVPEKFRSYLKNHLPIAGEKLFYFDYGDKTLDSLYKPHQVLVDEILTNKGYSPANRVTREFAGADHSEKSWGQRLQFPLEFLLKKRP